MEKREGAIVFDGTPATLVGPEIKVGQKAPDFHALDTERQTVTLADSAGTIRLFSSVPDLEIPICNLQTQRLEQEAKQFSNVLMYTISTDPPPDQQHYCSEYAIENLKTLSDYPQYSFGKAYGVLIEGLNRLVRAVFVIDGKDLVRYVEYAINSNENIDDFQVVRTLKALSNEEGTATTGDWHVKEHYYKPQKHLGPQPAEKD